MRSIILNSFIIAFIFFSPLYIHAQDHLPPRTLFKVGDSAAFVVEAKHPGKKKPWVWYAPTLKNYPNKRHDWYFSRLVANGISIAGIDQGEVRGSPASNQRFTAFYQEMVRRGFSRRPVLLGQSRGGLMMLSWAMGNPDKLKAFVGIYPVCNLASWPLKNSKTAVLEDYAIPEKDLLANLNNYNPIDNLKGLLANKIPMFIIHGDSDEVVPYKENSKLIRDRYEAAGSNISIKIVDGGKHEETNAFFECPELLDFIYRQVPVKKPKKIDMEQPARPVQSSTDQGLQLMGNRFYAFSTVFQVNQVETLQDESDGTDESVNHAPEGLHYPELLQHASKIDTIRAFIDDEAPGWRPLTAAEFTQVNSANDTWSWKDGVLYCTGQPVSVLRTIKEFGNFEMVVEWMHEKPAGNSGVFVWATPPSIEKLTAAGKPGLPDGIEVQMLDHGFTDLMKAKGAKTDWFGTNGDVFPVRVKMTPFPPLSPDGSRSFPRKHLAKGHGEWNHYYIRAINGEVRLWVNGEEVSGGTSAEPRKGYLCLESEGSPIQFRKLRVRELP